MKMKSLRTLIISVFISSIAVILSPGSACSETVYLPVTIDYQLLRSFVMYTAYTGPDGTATVFHVNRGCREIIMADPQYTMENARIRFETKIRVRAGTYQNDTCRNPIEWEGYLSIAQNARIDDKSWMLSFQAVDSVLLDKNHKPADVPDSVRELIDAWVYDYVGHITVTLFHPVSEIQRLLRELLPPDLRFLAEKMIYSMKAEKVMADSDALRIYIRLNTNALYAKKNEIRAALSPREKIQDTTRIWQAWDALLVHMIDAFAREPLTDEERLILFNTLLETRHAFITEMTAGTLTRDFVREEFTAAWEQLAPIFRNHMVDTPSQDLVSYLAFFTAADTVAALHEIIRDVGIEINEKSLTLLARLLNRGESDCLEYSQDIDKKLRKILDLGDLPTEKKAIDTKEKHYYGIGQQSLRDHGNDPLWKRITFSVFSSAWATDNETETENNPIDPWVFSKNHVDAYVDRIKELLHDVTDETMKESSMPGQYNDLYRNMVLATAWQESCFRQFKVTQGELIYLRSYNDTSIGLMQINEIVWRGIYDPDLLKWNIQYNASAGCQILDLYLCRYALRKMRRLNLEKKIDVDMVARLVYAMYNGGPREFSKLLKRSRKEQYYLSDRLFWDKYLWVKNNEWHNVRKCLVGG